MLQVDHVEDQRTCSYIGVYHTLIITCREPFITIDTIDWKFGAEAVGQNFPGRTLNEFT